MGFKKATKAKAKLRLGMSAPAGAGKTYTALLAAEFFAKGGRVAVIDAEKGSASLYADRFDFDVLELDEHHRSPEGYVEAIREASRAGYDALVIDGITPEWDVCKSDNDKVAQARFRGNSWAAWSETTPRHDAFISAMLDFPGHLIATMRSKTAYGEAGSKGAPQKLGMAPIQRDGIDYEFGVFLELTTSHVANVSKTRCPAIADRMFESPGTKDGCLLFKEIDAWLRAGVDRPADDMIAALKACANEGALADLKERLKTEMNAGAYMPSELERVLHAGSEAKDRIAQSVAAEADEANRQDAEYEASSEGDAPKPEGFDDGDSVADDHAKRFAASADEDVNDEWGLTAEAGK